MSICALFHEAIWNVFQDYRVVEKSGLQDHVTFLEKMYSRVLRLAIS